MEYFVHWLNGNAIGTWALTGTEPAEMHASVRPISSLTEVKLGASLYDHGSDIRAVRFATLRFSTGDDIEIDVKQWLGAQRERADQFIDEVLDALTASTRG